MRIQFIVTCADNGECWVELSACVSHLIMPLTHTRTHRNIVSVSVYRGELIKNSIIEIANNNRLKVTRLRNVGNVFYTLCLPLPVSSIPVPSLPPSAFFCCLSFCYEYVSSLCWLHNNWITFSYIYWHFTWLTFMQFIARKLSAISALLHRRKNFLYSSLQLILKLTDWSSSVCEVYRLYLFLSTP